MAKALFCSPTFIKNNSPTNLLIEDKFVREAISLSQDEFIKDSVGSGLYKELMDQVSISALTQSNITLMDDYILPCLLYYTVVKLLPKIHFKIHPKGIGKMESENEKPITFEEFKYLISDYSNSAQGYNKTLIDFLRENVSTYPLYENPGNGLDTVHPVRSDNFFQGMYFPKYDCKDE